MWKIYEENEMKENSLFGLKWLLYSLTDSLIFLMHPPVSAHASFIFPSNRSISGLAWVGGGGGAGDEGKEEASEGCHVTRAWLEVQEY